jgi:hypothetical protein
VAGPDGIVWDDEAPAQAAPVVAASDGIQWDPSPSFRNVRSGSDSRVNFDGVRAGSQSRVESLTPDVPGGDAYGYGGAMQAIAPMSQFAGIDPVGRIGETVGDIGSAATTFEPYGDLPGDERRRIGFGEGAARTFGEDILAAAPSALLATNPILAGANALYGRMTGNQTPLQRAEQGIHENVGVNENTMTFESPGAEFWSTMAGHAAGAAIPLGPAGEVRAGERAAAVAGHFGPEAQGAAVADDILATARPQEAAGARSAPEAAEVAPAPSAPMEVTELRPEDVPEAFRSKLGQQETPTVEATPEELAAFERQRAPAVVDQPTDPFQNNASGESAASIEAQSRRDQERAAGQSRMLIEPNGEVIPLTGVDAVDAHARPGQVIVQRGIGEDTAGWTILSHGDNVPPRLAQGRVNASRARLDLAHAELTPEAPHAGEVRSNTGQPPVPREVGAGSEADRSGDLQQPAQAGPSAGDGARPAGTAPNESVRGEYGAAPGQGPLTSVKNRVVADERSARGMDELDYEGKRTFGDAWEKGRARMAKDESEGQSLAQSVIERPRPLTGEEAALLSMERARLNKVHRESMADIAHAMETGDIEAETIARGRLRETEGQLETADRAARASGYEGGFGLGARRMMTKEDYSLAEMLTEAKVRKGQELTPKDRARVESIAARLEGVERELAAVRAQAAKKATRRAPREVHEEYAALKEQLKAIPKKEHTLCGVA